MPAMPCSRSPQSPVRNAGRTGTPPATDAPNSSWQPFALANCSRSGPWRAMSCLLAVTTDLPAFSAPRTNSSAGVNPPINSTTMSASELRMVWKSSVQTTSLGIDSSVLQACFLRSTLRLQMCVRRSIPSLRWQRILATGRPTVPRPTSAIRRGGVRSRETAELAFDACSGGVLCNVCSRSRNSFLSYVGLAAARSGKQRPSAQRGRGGWRLTILDTGPARSFVDSRMPPPTEDATENRAASRMPLRVFSEIRALRVCEIFSMWPRMWFLRHKARFGTSGNLQERSVAGFPPITSVRQGILHSEISESGYYFRNPNAYTGDIPWVFL